MSVQVVDVKTGKVKTMPEKHAQILVKLKRARWPEPPTEQHQAKVMTAAEPVVPVALVEKVHEEQPELKTRGRKPNTQE